MPADLVDGIPLLDRVGMLAITRETHTVAESIERHVKTLDALHLATALLIGEPVTVGDARLDDESRCRAPGTARDGSCRASG